MIESIRPTPHDIVYTWWYVPAARVNVSEHSTAVAAAAVAAAAAAAAAAAVAAARSVPHGCLLANSSYSNQIIHQNVTRRSFGRLVPF